MKRLFGLFLLLVPSTVFGAAAIMEGITANNNTLFISTTVKAVMIGAGTAPSGATLIVRSTSSSAAYKILDVQNSAATTIFDIRVNSTFDFSNVAKIDTNGHLIFIGPTAPTVSGCGTGPTIVGWDSVGRVTVGSAPGSGCTITFANAFTNPPVCMCSSDSISTCQPESVLVGSVNLSAVAPTAHLAGEILSYICFGRE